MQHYWFSYKNTSLAVQLNNHRLSKKVFLIRTLLLDWPPAPFIFSQPSWRLRRRCQRQQHQQRRPQLTAEHAPRAQETRRRLLQTNVQRRLSWLCRRLLVTRRDAQTGGVAVIRLSVFQAAEKVWLPLFVDVVFEGVDVDDVESVWRRRRKSSVERAHS